MANNETENILGFTDIRNAARAGVTAPQVTTIGNYLDVATLRARLTAINSTTYSSTVLDKMTKNDMVYAIRVNDDAAGIR